MASSKVHSELSDGLESGENDGRLVHLSHPRQNLLVENTTNRRKAH